MADSTAVSPRSVTLLGFLMRERHLTRADTIKVLDRRARQMRIMDFTLSLRQLDRWLAGEVGDPYAVRCRVAEAEFGYTIQQLLAPAPATVVDGPLTAIIPTPLEELEEIARRCQRTGASNLDDAALGRFQTLLEDIGRAYESSGATRVYPTVLRQRRWVDELMQGSQPLHQRVELYVVAGTMSAVLGYLAFDRGETSLAHSYCDEAFELSQEADHHDLAAWVRGIQSFVAYYNGRYTEALELARDGQRWANGGPQSIRLAASGEARALGRLGDRSGVQEAIDRALTERSRLHEADPVGCFLSLEPLGSARLYGNAASAYVPLGERELVQDFTQRAIAVFEENNSTASHALTLMDLAVAHLSPGGEPDKAWEALQTAMAVGEGLSSEVVCRRTQHVLTVASRRKDVSCIADMTEALRSWQPFIPSLGSRLGSEP